MAVLRDTIEHLTNRANATVWGVRIVYTPLGGSAVSTTPAGTPLVGVFDSAHLITQRDEEGAEISDRAPMLEIVLEDVAFTPQPGDKYTISEGPHAGEVYTVQQVDFDSAQAAMLLSVSGDHST